MTKEDYTAINDLIDILEEDIELLESGYSTIEDLQTEIKNLKNFCKGRIPPFEPPYTVTED